MSQLEKPKPYIMVAIEDDAKSVLVHIEPPQPPLPQSINMIVDDESQPPELQSMDTVWQSRVSE
jgi:hypothetical protein